MQNAQAPVVEDGPNNVVTRNTTSNPDAVKNKVPQQQGNSSGEYVQMAHNIPGTSQASGASGVGPRDQGREHVQSTVISNKVITINRRKSSEQIPPLYNTYDVNTRRMSQTL